MSILPDDRQLQAATDADLRQLIFEHPYVLVKFIDADCSICKLLAPKMTAFANDPRFAHVLFLRVDANESPVARQQVGFTRAPFFAAYRDGKIVHCETLFTEGGVEDLLDHCLAEAGPTDDC